MVKYTGTLHQLCDGAESKSSSSSTSIVSSTKINKKKKAPNWSKLLHYLHSNVYNLRLEAMDRQGPHGDETPLRIAILNHAPNAIVEALLNVAPEAARLVDDGERMPLHWACRRPTEDVEPGVLKGIYGRPTNNNGVKGGTAAAGPASSPSAPCLPTVLSVFMPGVEATNVIRTLIHFLPKSVYGRDHEGKTPLHWLFLFFPATRTVELLELFGRECPVADMPEFGPPGRSRPVSAFCGMHSNSLAGGNTAAATMEGHKKISGKTTTALESSSTILSTPLRNTNLASSTNTGLPLPFYSSHAHVHSTPCRSPVSRTATSATSPANHELGDDIWGAQLPYPNLSYAIPDNTNCLPLHYAVNMDNSQSSISNATSSPSEYNNYNDYSSNYDASNNGQVDYGHSLHILMIHGMMASRDVIRHMILCHPNSILWRDFHDRTPALYHLLNRDYYSSLVSAMASSSNMACWENVPAITMTLSDNSYGPSKTLLLQSSYPANIVENIGDEEHSAVVTSTGMGESQDLECTLPADEAKLRLQTNNDDSNGNNGTPLDDANTDEEIVIMDGDDALSIMTANNQNNGENRAVTATTAMPWEKSTVGTTVLHSPSPPKFKLVPKYPGASTHLLPTTVLSSSYPIISQSVLSYLLNDTVCIMGDATFNRTPLHWACYLLITSQIHSHLEQCITALESDNDLTDKCRREEEEEDQGGNDEQDSCSLKDGDISHKTNISFSCFRSIIQKNCNVITMGDAMKQTPLHVMLSTAFILNCVVYNHLNEEEEAMVSSGGEGELVGEVLCDENGGAGGGRSSKKGRRFNSNVNNMESGSNCLSNYWKKPPPPVDTPQEYIKILLNRDIGTTQQEQHQSAAKRGKDHSSSAAIAAQGKKEDTAKVGGILSESDGAANDGAEILGMSYDRDGRLPIHYATLAAAKAPILELLIHAHPMGLIATEDVYNRTPLHFAFSSPVTACHQSITELLALLQCTHIGQHIDSSKATSELALTETRSGKVDLDIGIAALKMEDANGNFPLHLACENGATVSVLRQMILAHDAALLYRNGNGDIPLMTLVGKTSVYERSLCNKKERETANSTNATRGAKTTSMTDMAGVKDVWEKRREKVLLQFESVFSPNLNHQVVVDDENIVAFLSSTSSICEETPLHIALWHELPPIFIRRMLEYKAGMDATAVRTVDGYLPIDVHEMRKSSILRRTIEEDCLLTHDEWNEIQELLFVHNPLVEPYRVDKEDLLPRIIDRIRREVVLSIRPDFILPGQVDFVPDIAHLCVSDAIQSVAKSEEKTSVGDSQRHVNRHFSPQKLDVKTEADASSPNFIETPSVVVIMAWKFFATFTNLVNSEDHYATTIQAIVEDLPYECVLYLCSLMSWKEGIGQKHAYNKQCLAELDKLFFLFGSFKFFTEKQVVLPTGTVICNYGVDGISSQPFLVHRSKNDNSIVLKVECASELRTIDGEEAKEQSGRFVCLKLLKSREAFKREIDTLHAVADEKISSISQMYFHYSFDGTRKCDRRFFSDLRQDRFSTVFKNGIITDIAESTLPSFCDFRYAIVTSLAKSDLMKTYLHQGVSMSQIKAGLLDVGIAVDAFHRNDRVHRDIRVNNILLRNDGGWSLTGLSLSRSVFPDAIMKENSLSTKVYSGVTPPEMVSRLPLFFAGNAAADVDDSRLTPVPAPVGAAVLFEGHRYAIAQTPHSPLERSLIRNDLWGFGCLLYLLCSGRTLFPLDVDGKEIVESESYACLATWDKEKLEAKVFDLVQDELAQDLLLQLLAPVEFRSALTMSKVIRHPFFEVCSPLDALNKRASDIADLRKSQRQERNLNLMIKQSLQDLSFRVASRTTVVRRMPFELIRKLDHATLALSIGCNLIETDNDGNACPPLSFVILPYKLAASKNGKLMPSSKKGVELAEKLGKSFLRISLAIDKYLLDPRQTAKNGIVEALEGTLRLFPDSSKSYFYLVDQYHGVPVVPATGDVYPSAIPGTEVRDIFLRYLPFMYITILHARGSTGDVSGLVKLIFEGAFPHIPNSWIEPGTATVHKFDEDAMTAEVKTLLEAVDSLEQRRHHPDLMITRESSIRKFFEKIDPAKTFANLKRVTDGGAEDLWTTDEGVREIQGKCGREHLEAAYQDQLDLSEILNEKDRKIKDLETQLTYMEKENKMEGNILAVVSDKIMRDDSRLESGSC